MSESLTLAEASAEAERVVNDTVEHVAADLPAAESGLGELHCDPQGSGLMYFDHAKVVDDVPDDEIDEIVEAAWAYWQELGFEADSIGLGDDQPNVNARWNGYRGEILGNRELHTVQFGVSTPCLPGE